MSNIARRILALEKQAAQAAQTHEERLSRLLGKGRGRLPPTNSPVEPGERQRIAEKVQALRVEYA
jgi:hypothetical protein